MTTEIQASIIKKLEIVQDFDVAKEARRRIDFLKEYLFHSGLKSYVLGISGGVDSATAGLLAQKAVSELRDEGYDCEFIAVRIPYGPQKDEAEAAEVIRFISPDDIYKINIKPATDAMMNAFAENYTSLSQYTNAHCDFNKGNVKARMRMVSQYLIAGFDKGVVIGTDHGAEAVMGFYTKFGDGAADILPLSGLNKRRVRAIAEFMGLPSHLVKKVPTADLEDDRPQLPDEEAHGVSYEQIDDFLEGKDIDKEAHDIIVAAYEKTEHKRNLPVTP